MTWVSCECIRVSLTWGVGVETCFHWHLLFFAYCPLVYKVFKLSGPVHYDSVCCSFTCCAAILEFEANGRFEETTRPIRRYVSFAELLCLVSGPSGALWRMKRCRTSSLASL